jgi:hypothetical protein
MDHTPPSAPKPVSDPGQPLNDDEAGPEGAADDGTEDATEEVVSGGLLPRRRRKKRRKRLSELLTTMVEADSGPVITVGDLLRGMHGRAFGALLLIFAFPNVLPAPPGLAGILGLPLIYLSAQMMLGRSPWLPPFIDKRSLTRDSFRALIARANPFLQRAERLLKYRLGFLTSPLAERLLGALCLSLSLILVLPIPFGNMLPSLAICIIALGVLERDGLWIIVGLAAAVSAFFWVGGLAYALAKSAIFLVLNAF